MTGRGGDVGGAGLPPPLQFAIAFLLLGMVPPLLWPLLLEWGWLGPGSGPAARQAAGMGLAAVATLLLLGFARWSPPAGGLRPWAPGAVARAFAGFAPLWWLALVGYLAAARALGAPVEPQPLLEVLAVDGLAGPAHVAAALGAVVVAPLAEELVFRGYLLAALLPRCGPWSANLLTAAAFGAVHTLPYALPTALLGLFFGWLRLHHGGLGAAVLAHALHNASVVLLCAAWPEAFAFLYPA